MLPSDSRQVVDRLLDLQRAMRDRLIASRATQTLHHVDRATAADTIYQIDTLVDPILEAFCEEWAKTTPLVLVAEGMEDESGREGSRVFPRGTKEEDAAIRLLVDPIDGTRGLMYDKRPAWSLAGVAPNRGARTCLRDIEAAVMTELPTAKQGFADVLWAAKGRGAHGQRIDLSNGSAEPLTIHPSAAESLDHGFASVSNFFPGTKMLAAELMEHLAANLIGPADVTRATVFEDQYISTGGQWYELIVGHDRFSADLRSHFYRIQKQPQGLCVHPYDAACLLIAEEAGVIVTDGLGNLLDGPMDVTTGLSWAGYANPTLQRQIEPLLKAFLRQRGINGP